MGHFELAWLRQESIILKKMQIGYISSLVNACKNCSFLFGVSGRHATIHIPQEVGNLGLVLGLGRSVSM